MTTRKRKEPFVSIRRSLSAVVVMAGVLLPFLAQAVPVSVRAWPHEGYGRVVFDWPQIVDFQLAQQGNQITVSFSEPIEPDLSSLYAVMGDYVSSVALGSDGRSVILNTTRDVTLNAFQNDNNVVVDLRDTSGTARAQPVVVPGQPPVATAEAPTVTQQTQPAAPAASVQATAPTADLPFVNVRAGRHPTYNRLVFDWETPVNYTLSREGGVLTVRFDQPARTNVGQLNLSRTPFFAGPQESIENGGLRVTVGVPESGTLRDLKVGERVVIDVLADQSARATPPGDAVAGTPTQVAAVEPVEPTPNEAVADSVETPESANVTPNVQDEITSEAQPQLDQPAPDEAPNASAQALPSAPELPSQPLAVPQEQSGGFGRIASDVVASPQFDVQMQPIPGGLRMTFVWPEDVAAAVFPRAGYYWVAFDKPGRASFPTAAEELTRIVPLAEQVSTRRGTALRFLVAGGLRPSISREGSNWEIIFRQEGGSPQSAIPVVPDAGSETPRIFLPVDDAADRVDFTDPEVGDQVQVIPVGQAGAGVVDPRNFIEFQLLPTLQGVAVVPFAESVFVQPRRNGAQVVSDEGLILSPPLGDQEEQVADGFRNRFPDVEGDTYKFRTWQRVSPARYQDERKALLLEVSRAPTSSRSVARKDLALFKFAHGLNAEAVGILNRINEEDPTYYLTDELQQVAAAAQVMMQREEEAELILFKPRFDQDNEVALFRGLHYAQQGEWERALPYLIQGQDMIDFFPVEYRGRFRLALAEANIEMDNPDVVEPIVADILDEEMPVRFHDQARYLDALALAAQGQWNEAFGTLEELADSEDRWTAARARLADIRFKVEQEELTLNEAVDELELMRFAWRGGDFELGLVRDLANFHYLNGDYRNSLLTMRQTLGNFTGHPDAARVANEMNGVFEELYLEGRADELPPVRALALYQDFRELTPVGDKGDQMIRYLADRLVQVDLLDQAAELLRHQLDFRLSGSRRAEVARQLAVIYLLNRQPREALRTIRATEFSEIPQIIRRQRRHLEARALADMDRFDDALALLAADQSTEAEMLRADVSWRAKEWANAARSLSSLLGTKFREPEAVLERREREWLLQSAVALNMAGDREGLDLLRDRWTPKLEGSAEADTFASLTAVVDPSAFSYRELAPAIAGVEGLEAFMSSYRERLREGGLSAIN